MRPYRAQYILQHVRGQSSCISKSNSRPQVQPHHVLPLPITLNYQVRTRRDAFPSESHFQTKISRFARYQDHTENVLTARQRNPMDYVNRNRIKLRRKELYNRWAYVASFGLVLYFAAKAYYILNFGEDTPSSEKQEELERQRRTANKGRDRLDASPAEEAALRGKEVVVHVKPGTEKLVDEDGTELVSTGTSTIPHFPRTIKLPATTSASGGAVSPTTDEYTLLGLGIRTVSFLSIQVYVVGLYIRNADLPALQAAFVHRANPIASALIPMEKATLKEQLLQAEQSVEIWDMLLRETGVKSTVRIVPVRNTDFQHLRDGWVRGITGRTQEASRAGSKEFDDEGFGEAMKAFKGLFGGKGKAPWGSTVLLARDGKGVMTVLYEEVKRKKDGGKEVIQRVGHELLGTVEDERISRQIWLGYLGGKHVSSEGARKSIVDGVMELVERPVGTVGAQVT